MRHGLFGSRAFYQRRPSSHGTCDALQVLRSKVIKLEQVADELPSALRNDHPVRLRNTLQTRGKVRCLAYNGLLLRSGRIARVLDQQFVDVKENNPELLLDIIRKLDLLPKPSPTGTVQATAPARGR